MLPLRRLPSAGFKFASAFSTTSIRRGSVITPSPAEVERAIHDKLKAKLSPSHLQVQDVSGGCGTFYAITIASGSFKGLPIVKQHKLVTEALKEDIPAFHGLQIKTIPV